MTPSNMISVIVATFFVVFIEARRYFSPPLCSEAERFKRSLDAPWGTLLGVCGTLRRAHLQGASITRVALRMKPVLHLKPDHAGISDVPDCAMCWDPLERRCSFVEPTPMPRPKLGPFSSDVAPPCRNMPTPSSMPRPAGMAPFLLVIGPTIEDIWFIMWCGK